MDHHLLVFANPTIARHVAAQLADDGFEAVTTERGVDGSTEVAIDDHRLPVTEGSAAVEGLRTRFQALADEHDGHYVEAGPGQAGSGQAGPGQAGPAQGGGGGGSW